MEEEYEGKDLAQEMKQEAIERYKKVILDFKMGKGKLPAYIKEVQNIKIDEQGKEHKVTSLEVYIPFTRENGEVDYIKIATIDEQGVFNKNTDILNDNSYSDSEKENLQKIIEGFGIDGDTVDMDNLNEQLEKAEAKTIEQIQKERENQNKEISIKDDNQNTKEDNVNKKEEQNIETGEEKQAIARKYNLNTNQIIFLDMDDEKITEDERFVDLVKWAKGKKNIAIIQGEDERNWKVIGREEEEQEYTEIEEANNQPYGKNPDEEIKIQRIDNTKITDEGTEEQPHERPISVHPIDSDSMVAIVENNGRKEALYCRKAEGENEYIGILIPEDSKRNVRQPEKDKRDVMTKEFCSDREIGNLIDTYDVLKDLYKRGVPQGNKAGEQVNKTQGDDEQAYKMVEEDIADDLYKRSGLADKMKGAMPGHVEYMYEKFREQAPRIIKLMRENENMTYEEAVEITNREGQREGGGPTPGENRKGQH